MFFFGRMCCKTGFRTHLEPNFELSYVDEFLIFCNDFRWKLTQADPWKCIKNIRMKNGTHFCVFSSMKRCNAKSCLYKNWKITCINFFSTSDCHQLLLFRSNRTRLQKNTIFAFIYDDHLLFWRFLQYLQKFELFKCTFSIS